MKKIINIVGITVITVLSGFLLMVSTGQHVSAKATAIPKTIRGSWYQYLGNGHYSKVTFSKHKVLYVNYYGSKYHKQGPDVVNASKKKHGWYEIKDSDQKSGLGTYYRVKKSSDKSQLQVAYGKKITRNKSINYYETRAQAKD
ncbi:hypothetical protein [Lentilactobacillus sp. Marseille-Q4993]|uniref:hypothetical protein n=1 Tax=Lentilactobacillus sp. Marseille-Q4993 TaxID=3039492 RepID=UPI0024BCB557|nr:hypothetical protein [Lentilactobacillus sp. Marseille-Q4993]